MVLQTVRRIQEKVKIGGEGTASYSRRNQRRMCQFASTGFYQKCCFLRDPVVLLLGRGVFCYALRGTCGSAVLTTGTTTLAKQCLNVWGHGDPRGRVPCAARRAQSKHPGTSSLGLWFERYQREKKTHSLVDIQALDIVAKPLLSLGASNLLYGGRAVLSQGVQSAVLREDGEDGEWGERMLMCDTEAEGSRD
eukprot:1790979-Rhodomonas_salina.1